MATTAASALFGAPNAAQVNPEVTVLVPVANPCAPNASMTVTYGYTEGTAGCLLSVYAHANAGTADGVLVYAGDPTTDLPAVASPVANYAISAASDNGLTGTKTFTPVSGQYWPGTTCRWEAVMTTPDGTDAVSNGTQVVDTTLIPPPTSRRLPGSTHTRNRYRRR